MCQIAVEWPFDHLLPSQMRKVASLSAQPLSKKFSSLQNAAKSQEVKTPQEKIDALCDPDKPTYKQNAACTQAIEEARASAMQKLEEKSSVTITVESYNRLNDSGKMVDHDNLALLDCQMQKYADDYGQKAAVDHAEDILSGLMLAEYQHPKDSFDKQMKKELEKTGAEP